MDAEAVLKALGGWENLDSLEACITRLRLEVVDPDAVDEAALKRLGAAGVMKMGKIVQVVVGTEAETLAEELEDLR